MLNRIGPCRSTLGATSSYCQALSAITGIGALLFFLVVALLPLVQPEYDPFAQFISELALGPCGGIMLFAFAGLAIAIGAAGLNVQKHGSPIFLPIFLWLAAACFLVAGFVTLGTSVQVHTLSMAAAFVFCAASMYAMPRVVIVLSSPRCYLASWASCFTMCAATAIGGNLVSSGIAQRISAFALLFWLSFLALRLAR